MTPEQTDSIVSFLNEAWPQRPIGPMTAGIWGSALAKFPHEQVAAVLTRLVHTEKYRPALSDLLTELQPPAVGETASEAFTKVWAEMGRVGRGGKPELSDRAAKAVKHMGGWETICCIWQQPSIHFHRKEFTREFDQLEGVEARREKHQATMGDGGGVDGKAALGAAVKAVGEGMKR